MLTQLLRFESSYQIKQPSFIIFLLGLLSYGVVINANVVGQGMELLNINSPYRLSYFIALTSVLSIFAAMMFCVNSLLRDKDHKFDGIVSMLAIKQRFTSCTIAILMSTLCVVSILSLGLMLGMLSPSLDPEKISQFSLNHYLWPWLVFVLPNTIIATSILVAVTLKKQNAFATYITAISLFIFFWVSMMFIGAPVTGSMVFKDPSVVSIFALLDPFGTSAFFEQSQFWTPTQKNEQLFSLSGSLLLNRVIWLSIALAVFLYLGEVVIQHFQPSENTLSKKRKNSRNKSKIMKVMPSFFLAKFKKHLEEPLVTPDTEGLKFQLLALLTLSVIEIKQIVGQWAFRVLVILVTGLAIVCMLMAVGDFSSGIFSGRYPTTVLLVSYSTEAFTPLVTAIIIFYSAEKIWQEKLLKADSFIDSSPVANATIYGAKLLSLFFIPLFLVAMNIIASIVFQLANDYYRFEFAHYLSLFYFIAVPVLIQTVLIFFIQTRIASSRFANKYLGMMISALVIVLLAISSGLLGFEHPLLNINKLPSLLRIDSDLVGYGNFGIKFHYLAGFWGIFALIIAGLTVLKWNRGEWYKTSYFSSKRKSPSHSTHTNKQTITKLSRVYLPASLAALLAFGFFIQVNIPVKNDYQARDKSFDDQALYEHKYKQYQSLAIPQVSQMKLAVDFYPNQNSYSVKADYLLVNTGNETMLEVFVTARVPLQSIDIAGATVSLNDSTANWSVYLFTLKEPLLPGESLAMSYQLSQSSSAFAIHKGIVNNGSYLNHSGFEPLMGYIERIEINNKFERENRGLTAKATSTSDRTKLTDKGKFITQKRTFEAILSTSIEQTAVTSGQLVKTWQQDGRNYFHYKMQKAIYPLVDYISAVYETKSIEHNGVVVEMYFHPEHGINIDEMLRATKATLDYATTNLGPYAFDSLRILEVPDYHPFGGKATSGIVALSESLYIEDYFDGADINNTARNTIHEVMHQWWGEKLAPKITQGEGVLVESLTKYMEAVILEKMYGNTMARHLTKYTQRRYFSGRSYARTAEVGVIDADHERYLTYGKGPVVFTALKELLGEQKLNSAFKQLIDSHKYTLSATTDDLLSALFKIADDSQKDLIQDWLTKVIEYDLAINKAVVSELPDGRYEVVIDVKALRLSTDKDGTVSEIGINESIKIALYPAYPGRKNTESLSIENQLINQTNSTVTLIVEDKPSYVMIDPNYTRLDKDLSNNINKIEDE
ncbi:MAG: M1 family aminopeptidase [Colwellia sp.]|jgi:ABC-2 type transport system permease protein